MEEAPSSTGLQVTLSKVSEMQLVEMEAKQRIMRLNGL